MILIFFIILFSNIFFIEANKQGKLSTYIGFDKI